MDAEFASLLTGNNFHTPIDSLDVAVEKRFNEIKGSLSERPDNECKTGFGHVYDGSRCLPQNLGWRFRQAFGAVDPKEIIAGEFDTEIEETWHEAASSEHWYMYEKDWG